MADPYGLLQTTTAVVIMLMFFEMSGEVIDALREQSDLYLWTAGIAFVSRVLGNDAFLCFRRQRHSNLRARNALNAIDGHESQGARPETVDLMVPHTQADEFTATLETA